MDLQLADRVILVVGGTGLIGSAIVERLTQEGAIAIVASRTASTGIEMDARDDASVEAAIASVLDIHHRLDGVIVTAAPSARTLDPAKNSSPDQVLDAMDAKAVSFLRVANAALPIMTAAGYGRVVGVSGQNAFVTGNMAGSVRNASLMIIAKNLADTVAGTGVTVNVIHPGTVTDDPTKVGESTPADSASLAAFLVSPLAGAISGEAIAVGHRVRGAISL